MKRALSLLAALLMVVVVGLLATGSPASAAFSNCPSNKFCVWIDSNGGGTMYYWDTAYLGHCQNIGYPFNDQVSSIRNNYSSPWKVSTYYDANCLGGITSDYSTFQGYVGSGQQMNLTGFHNDQSSSFKVYQ